MFCFQIADTSQRPAMTARLPTISLDEPFRRVLKHVPGLTVPELLVTMCSRVVAKSTTGIATRVGYLPLHLKTELALYMKVADLIAFVSSEGGLSVLKLKCCPSDFQKVLYRLNHYLNLDENLSNRERRWLIREKRLYVLILQEAKTIDHAFHRCQPGGCNQRHFEPALEEEEQPAKLFNAFNSVYRTGVRLRPVEWPTLDHPFPKSWISHLQSPRPAHPFGEPPQNNSNERQNQTRSGEFEVLTDDKRFYRLLGALENSHRLGINHATALLVFFMLLDTERLNWHDRDHRLFKITVLCRLTKSLAAFYANFQMLLTLLARTRPHVYFPSDGIHIVLLRQHLAAKYGLFDEERRLFNHLLHTNELVSGRVAYREIILTHKTAVFDAANVGLIECFAEWLYHCRCNGDRVEDATVARLLATLEHLEGEVVALRAELSRMCQFRNLTSGDVSLLKCYIAMCNIYIIVIRTPASRSSTNFQLELELARQVSEDPDFGTDSRMFCASCLMFYTNTIDWDTHQATVQNLTGAASRTADLEFSPIMSTHLIGDLAMILTLGRMKHRKGTLLRHVDWLVTRLEQSTDGRHFYIGLLRKLSELLNPDSLTHREESERNPSCTPKRYFGTAKCDAEKWAALEPRHPWQHGDTATDFELLNYIVSCEPNLVPRILRAGREYVIKGKFL